MEWCNGDGDPCEGCGALIDEAIVEAFEETGKIMCESCWDAYCEEDAL